MSDASSNGSDTSGGNLGAVALDERWLALTQEEILEPELPIIDAHHHLWDHRGRYMLDEILADIGSGHNIRATVHVEADAMYRAGGDPAFACVGETEFVNGVAAMSASGLYGAARVCAGIVGFADMRLGDRVAEVLDAHIMRAGQRFKGIRHCAAFDRDPSVNTTPIPIPEGLMGSAEFRSGFRHLAPRGLSFDGWLYHTQIAEFAALADAHPETVLILNHVGAPIGIGSYAEDRMGVFTDWSKAVRELARRPNVRMKLGGLGMTLFGFGFEKRERPASSTELAEGWRPHVEHCIEQFGVERCMFESNFPVDKETCSYALLWNAFKRLAGSLTPNEKHALFFETARRAYRLDLAC